MCEPSPHSQRPDSTLTHVCWTLTGGKYGGSAYGPDGQRRSGQWDSSGRGGEWGTDRPDSGRDLAGGRADERGRGPGGSGSVSSGGSGGGCDCTVVDPLNWLVGLLVAINS